PRLAQSAALDVVADAALMGVARDPVLSAWPDPDLPAGLPAPAIADLRRLFARRRALFQLAFRLGCDPARAAAGLVDHPGGDRRLGPRHARHDGDDDGRGLRRLRRG